MVVFKVVVAVGIYVQLKQLVMLVSKAKMAVIAVVHAMIIKAEDVADEYSRFKEIKKGFSY
jgi:hypothetical protein